MPCITVVMRRSVAFAIVMAFCARGYAETLRLKIFYAGSEVGFSHCERTADGKYSESTELNLGPTKISASIVGRYEDNKLVEFVSRPQPNVSLSLKDGKVKVKNGDKEIDVPYDAKLDMMIGNLLPQLNTGALLNVDYARKEPQAVKGFMPEAGVVATVNITPLASRTVSVNGAMQTVRVFKFAFPTVEVEYVLSEQNLVVAMDVPSQKLRLLADGWDALYTDPIAAFPELSQATFKVRSELNVKVAMRDGVKLATDIVLPDAKGQYPVILVRTPYGRSNETLSGGSYAKRGYVYVTQDCRGREDSDGEWDPFVHEGRDGFDTIAWISKQPWSNGKVGTIGASYAGFVQWAAAVERPEALKCMIPQVSPPDAMHNLPYDFGVFALWPNLWWSRIVSDKHANLAASAQKLPHGEKLTTLPLSKIDDEVLGKDIPFFNQWLERPTSKEWPDWDFTDHISRSRVPSLMISGWWDGDGIGTKLNWAGMRKAGRKDQWLIYGPWPHAFNSTTKVGDMDYGPTAILDLDSLYLRWFDHWLKGKSVGLEKLPKVRAFVAGANEWKDLTDWPENTTPIRRLFLGANGSATGTGKHGQLLAAPTSEITASTYTYDPSKDVGVDIALLYPDLSKVSLKVDLGAKADTTLLFRSEPMTKRTAIAGPIEVNLEFKTTAKDTDFYARLVDEDEQGVMRMIGQIGKVRGSYIGGTRDQKALIPGRVYKTTILPWDTAYEFKPGHRITLMVSSSMFPLYSRNLGTAEPIDFATRMVPQTNTILHDAKHPSSVTFRVLWERE